MLIAFLRQWYACRSFEESNRKEFAVKVRSGIFFLFINFFCVYRCFARKITRSEKMDSYIDHDFIGTILIDDSIFGKSDNVK